MQTLLKDLIAGLYADAFKASGFKKKQARFSRVLDGVVQEIGFQSSQWNSSGDPIVFYVNIQISFLDIPRKNGSPILGHRRIGGLVNGAPAQFELTETNASSLRRDLITYLNAALQTLPSQYEEVRKRALNGFSTHIPCCLN